MNLPLSTNWVHYILRIYCEYIFLKFISTDRTFNQIHDISIRTLSDNPQSLLNSILWLSPNWVTGTVFALVCFKAWGLQTRLLD